MVHFKQVWHLFVSRQQGWDSAEWGSVDAENSNVWRRRRGGHLLRTRGVQNVSISFASREHKFEMYELIKVNFVFCRKCTGATTRKSKKLKTGETSQGLLVQDLQRSQVHMCVVY